MSHCSEVSMDSCLSSCMDINSCVDERVMAYVDDMYGAYLLLKLSENTEKTKRGKDEKKVL
jgi:hypothetical protein